MDHGQARLIGQDRADHAAQAAISGAPSPCAFAAEGADLVLNTRANRARAGRCRGGVQEGGRARAAAAAPTSPMPPPSRRWSAQARADCGAIDVLCLQCRDPAAQGGGRDVARGLAPGDRRESRLGVLPGARGGARDEGALAREHHRAGRAVEPRTGLAEYRCRHRGQDRVSWASCARSPPSSAPSASAPTWWCGFIDTERRYAEWYPEFRRRSPGGAEQLKQIPLGRLGRPEDIADACSRPPTPRRTSPATASASWAGGPSASWSEERATASVAPATAVPRIARDDRARRTFVCGAQTWPALPYARTLRCGHRAPPRAGPSPRSSWTSRQAPAHSPLSGGSAKTSAAAR